MDAASRDPNFLMHFKTNFEAYFPTLRFQLYFDEMRNSFHKVKINHSSLILPESWMNDFYIPKNPFCKNFSFLSSNLEIILTFKSFLRGNVETLKYINNWKKWYLQFNSWCSSPQLIMNPSFQPDLFTFLRMHFDTLNDTLIYSQASSY